MFASIAAILLLPLVEDPLTALQRFPNVKACDELRSEAAVYRYDLNRKVDDIWWRHLDPQFERQLHYDLRMAMKVEDLYMHLGTAWWYANTNQASSEMDDEAKKFMTRIYKILGPEDYWKGRLPRPVPPYYP